MRQFKVFEKWHKDGEFDLVFLLNNEDDQNIFSDGRLSQSPFSLIKLAESFMYGKPTPVIIAEFLTEEDFEKYISLKKIGKFPFISGYEKKEVRGLFNTTEFIEITQLEAEEILQQ